jgi:ferredoxin
MLPEYRRARRMGFHMKIVVDLIRCESYGQSVFAAPEVFHFHDKESLEYDYSPDDALRTKVERAAAACPVQAISIGWAAADEQPKKKEESSVPWQKIRVYHRVRHH